LYAPPSLGINSFPWHAFLSSFPLQLGSDDVLIILYCDLFASVNNIHFEQTERWGNIRLLSTNLVSLCVSLLSAYSLLLRSYLFQLPFIFLFSQIVPEFLHVVATNSLPYRVYHLYIIIVGSPNPLSVENQGLPNHSLHLLEIRYFYFYLPFVPHWGQEIAIQDVLDLFKQNRYLVCLHQP